MISRKTLVLLVATSLTTGCKLSVISTPYGSIAATGPAFTCTAGNVCDIDLVAGSNRTFTATALPGYQFVKWQAGSGAGNGGFLCANATTPTCTVALPNNPTGAAIAALPDNAYLMPVFKQL